LDHRERVRISLNHQEPDRIPIDLWGSASRITNDLYFNILKYLKIKDIPEKVRPGKTAEYVDYRISEMVYSDFRHTVIRSPKEFKSYTDKDGLIFDEWGIGYRMIGPYPQIAFHPLAEKEIDEIDNYKGPFIHDKGRLEGLMEETRDWFKNTNYCITATAPCSGLAWDYCGYLRGQENFLIDLYQNQKFAHKLLDIVSDIIAELYVFYIEPISKYIEWVEFESDYASQENLFIPREKYVNFIKKPNEKVFNAIKKVAPDAKNFLHSCGAIKDLIPELINSGVDILNSLQPGARGMDSFELKKEFGRDLVFHGGLDIQGSICGPIDEAIKEAKNRIKAFGPGGGYIFAPTNHFQLDTPVNNFFAVYKTAREFGKYPINI